MTSMSRPAQSPDINPIEIYGIIKHRISKKRGGRSHSVEITEILIAERELPKQLEECIAADGDFTYTVTFPVLAYTLFCTNL